jgi:hypothetical protein
LKDFDGAFGPIAHKFGMNWCIALGNHRPRVAIFVSNTITASSISCIGSEAENSRAIFH